MKKYLFVGAGGTDGSMICSLVRLSRECVGIGRELGIQLLRN